MSASDKLPSRKPYAARTQVPALKTRAEIEALLRGVQGTRIVTMDEPSELVVAWAARESGHDHRSARVSEANVSTTSRSTYPSAVRCPASCCVLSSEPIWVHDVALAASLDLPPVIV